VGGLLVQREAHHPDPGHGPVRGGRHGDAWTQWGRICTLRSDAGSGAAELSGAVRASGCADDEDDGRATKPQIAGAEPRFCPFRARTWRAGSLLHGESNRRPAAIDPTATRLV